MRLNDLDIEKHYSMSSLSNIVLYDGRRLDEALRNHPCAPSPKPNSEVPNAKTKGKYFLGIDILNFVDSCEKSKFKDVRSDALEACRRLSYAKHELELVKKEIDSALSQKNDALADYYDLIEKTKKKREDAERQVASFFNQYMWRSNKLLSSRTVCGVYFLRSRGEIIYVGQSVNILGRIGQHKQTKEFDSVSFVKCEKHNLNDVEGFFIRLLLPKMNIGSNGVVCGPSTSVERFEDITGLLVGVKHAAE